MTHDTPAMGDRQARLNTYLDNPSLKGLLDIFSFLLFCDAADIGDEDGHLLIEELRETRRRYQSRGGEAHA